ncbi:MAG: DUF402 domain-containing protein, partial [Candidatus Latescibacterota bacterium]
MADIMPFLDRLSYGQHIPSEVAQNREAWRGLGCREEGSMPLHPVTVRSRLGECAGQTDGRVAFFDDSSDTSTGTPMRHFVLLDRGVKLMHEPWGWTKEWYADIVRVDRAADGAVELTDLCIDVIIEGYGPAYRVIDLDDLADAASSGALSPSDLDLALRHLQRFLDECLHRGRDFPPACIRSYLAPHPAPRCVGVGEPGERESGQAGGPGPACGGGRAGGPSAAAARSMTHDVEWIQQTLAHRDTGAVPYNFSFSPPAQAAVARHYGDDLATALSLPVRMTGLRSVKPLYADPALFGPRATDEHGVTWTTSPIDRGAPVGPCLTAPTLAGYTFPDPASPHRFVDLAAWCARHEGHYRIVWAGDLW